MTAFRAVTEGHFFPSATSCVDFLNDKFSETENPIYCIKEIFQEALQKKRRDAKYTNYGKVPGSSKFRVMLFSPDGEVKAAPYLCTCEKCMASFGSCELFANFKAIGGGPGSKIQVGLI